jgi:hypothetical protein
MKIKGEPQKKTWLQKNMCSFEIGVSFRLHQRLPTDEPGRNDSLRGNGFRQETVLKAPQKFVGRSLRPLPPNTCPSLGVRSSYEILNIVPFSKCRRTAIFLIRSIFRAVIRNIKCTVIVVKC